MTRPESTPTDRARWPVRALWAVAGALLVVFLAKGFLGDLFFIKSGSMEPTLFGGEEFGETVLVRFSGHASLERFDLVVVERPGQRDAVVKRVAGLPGETVSIAGGDLVVNGRRLGWEVARPSLVPVYDSLRRPPPEVFFCKRPPDGPWYEDGDAWVVAGDDVERGSNLGMMLYGPALRDEHERPGGERHAGIHEVGDAQLELELSAAPGDGRIRLNLVEHGDTFEAVLDWTETGATRVSFERWVPDGAPAVLAERSLELGPDAWHAVRFRNIDNNLVFEVVGRGVLLAHRYEANQPYRGVVQGDDKSVGPRVAFGAEGLEVRFRHIRIERDLHYTDQGEYGVEAPRTLGLDEYFLLGDNSADSRDGRFWGAVSARQIVGRPVAVVRPWDRRRWLQGPIPPPELSRP